MRAHVFPFFVRAPFFGGIFAGFRIWYVFFACIVQLILLLQKQKKEGEKLKKKEEEKNQPQATGQGPKCPKCPGSPSTLQGCGRLKVTVSQSHGVQPHKQGHQGLDENKDERVKGTKTACHLGRRVTAQPGSRRTASLPPRPPPRSALQKKGGCSTSLSLKSTTNVTCKKRRVTARKSMRENRAKTKFSENAKTQKRLFFRKNACSERAGAAARAQLHLQVADVKDQAALLAHDPDLPGFDVGLALAAGLWPVSGSCCRQRPKSGRSASPACSAELIEVAGLPDNAGPLGLPDNVLPLAPQGCRLGSLGDGECGRDCHDAGLFSSRDKKILVR